MVSPFCETLSAYHLFKKNENSGEISDVVIVFRKNDGTGIGFPLPHSFFRVFKSRFYVLFFHNFLESNSKARLSNKKQLAKVNSTSNTTCNVNLEHKKFIGE